MTMEPKKVPAPGTIEHRRFKVSELRVSADAGKPKVISGYAAVYDQESEDLGYFVEVIRSGAFTETLKSADVRCLFNHDPNLILGRNKAGTLKLRDDPKGLYFECALPATSVAEDLAVSMARGDVDQMSFAFRTKTDRWTYGRGDQPPLRELLEVDIFDVSPVTFPAYPDTEVSLRRAIFQEAEQRRALSPEAAAARRRELELLEAELD